MDIARRVPFFCAVGNIDRRSPGGEPIMQALATLPGIVPVGAAVDAHSQAQFRNGLIAMTETVKPARPGGVAGASFAAPKALARLVLEAYNQAR